MVNPINEIKDLDLNFGVHPRTKDVSKLTGTRAINQHLKILVLTRLKTIPFAAHIGADVDGQLFENFTQAKEVLLNKIIKQLIRENETRIRVDRIVLNVEGYGLELDIVYEVINTGEKGEFSLILTKIR